MWSFTFAQVFTYLILICPAGSAFRIGLVLFGAWFCRRNPPLALLGIGWQASSLISLFDMRTALGFSPALSLKCDDLFWFVCTSEEHNPWLAFLSNTQLMRFAGILREYVENRCLGWDPVWGTLAFSVLMGGIVKDDIRQLYRNLGFLHVLVISGSQFTLLSRVAEWAFGRPFVVLYAFQLCDWRTFRAIRLGLDACLQFCLFIYLLACGLTPPCQRAFLERFMKFYSQWLARPGREFTFQHVLALQILIFPQTWFSLSNVLSWGAVVCLRAFSLSKGIADKMKASVGIQILSLVLFGRISLSSLALDVILAPIWDFMLLSLLTVVLLPDFGFYTPLRVLFGIFHDGLGQLDHWQTAVFGSSALTWKDSFEATGRLAAGGLLLALLLYSSASRLILKQSLTSGENYARSRN